VRALRGPAASRALARRAAPQEPDARTARLAPRGPCYEPRVLSPSEQVWPTRLWLVRHGESAGNVARDLAESRGLPVIDIEHRDVDVPLSRLGERQAHAVGKWFAEQPDDERPGVVLTSPYVRAMQTAQRIIDSGRLGRGPLVHVADERLREKEFGTLDRLTRAGIVARFPQEAQRRADVGKFYYRPPGGESWCDVILRLRSLLDHVQLQYRCERVLVVAHQVTVLCVRYLLERMTEAQILAIDREKDVANCSITTYDFAVDPDGRGALALRSYNCVTPVEDAGEPVTEEPDAPVSPR
jgi:probable phosphoglycerate mutase